MPYNTKVFNTSLQMSTRGRIGIELSDGSILSAYHHWDSYPSWLGRILKTHYNTREKVAELIDGGDMSLCWTDERWDDSGVEGVYGPQYYSQRGEDCPPRHDANKYDYLAEGEEYAYLFVNDEWVCYTLNENDYPTVVEIPSGALAV
jgi:hypothetical protein